LTPLISTSVNVVPILPALVLIGGALLVLVASLMDRRETGLGAGWIAVLSSLVAGATLLTVWENGITSFGGMVVSDGIGRFFSMLAVIVALVTSLTSLGVIGRWRTLHGEYHALVLMGAAGMCVMVVSVNLITLFLGLEILSLSLYTLTGYDRDRPRALEACMKYFLLGGVTSAILLFGIGLIYGVTGGTSFAALAEGTRSASGSTALMFYAGVGMLIIGFGFKIAAVPFHMWVPDVYQGAPTPVTGYMATGVKAAGFAALLRLFPIALDGIAAHWMEIFSVLAILTMVVGNVMALTQRDIKRLLAYSSIAHAGYLLVALVAAGGLGATDLGKASILFYSAVYAVTNLGAFAALCVFGPGREESTTLDDFAGFARRRPLAAAALTVFLFSLAGIPPTAGFAGKFYIFYAAVATGHVTLAIIGVMASLISVYYYLRVVIAMYMQEPLEDAPLGPLPVTVGVVLLVCVVGVLGLGVFPGSWMDIARVSIGG